MAHVLLAEDDNSLRQFLAKALARAGHAVVDCADGNDAMAQIMDKTREFYLLLADIVIPRLDGIELARRAGKEIPGLKVLFITGFAAIALYTKRTEPANETRILSKPFHLKDLVGEVDKILAA